MVTHHTEYTSGSLVFKSVEDKESADKSAKYKRLNVEIDQDGRRTEPKFELCRVNIPNGLKMEREPGRLPKLQAFVKFPTNRNEIEQDFREQNYDDAEERARSVYDEVMNCVRIPEMDEIRGWINKKDLELTVDVGECTGTAKSKDTKVFTSNTGSTVKTLIDKGMKVEVLGKSSDGKMLEVKSGGSEGFFSKLKQDVARIVFDNRVRCGMASKSYEDILAVVRDPIYHAREKTGELVLDKDPSSFMKVTYFPDNPKNGKSESVAKFSVPMGDNKSHDLDLNTLQSKSITCIPCLHLLYVYIGSGKVLPQFYITSAIVTAIDDFKTKRKTQQQSTINSLSNDTAMMEKLRAQVEKIKLSPVHAGNDSPPEETSQNSEAGGSVSNDSGGQSLEAFLESGPTLHDADLDNEIDDLSDGDDEN